ncbi:MAG: hybrid sensor histidine kinase/response regulator [Paludibacteraceae bacterium]
MNIESKIRFKAVALYVVVGFAVIAMLFFLYGLKNKVTAQRIVVENQYHSLTLTNALISAVNEAQSASASYISTKKPDYISSFAIYKAVVDSLIDTLKLAEPLEKERLETIGILLNRQAINIAGLSKRFGNQNPFDSISKRLKDYQPEKQRTINIVTVKKDTIYKSADKKNFFQRLKEVFNPVVDSTMVVSNQHIDTLKVGHTDSVAIVSEINKITQNASTNYTQNIKAIELQVVDLIANDREIARRVSSLTIELQRRMVDAILKSINKNEKSINTNYVISIAGAIVALALILLFILLIIYDVNKGKQAREQIRLLMENRHKLLLTVSHDIKSPLTSILGYSEKNRQNNEETRSIRHSAWYILSLLENLLEFSSLEQGALSVTRSDFSLKTVCDETGQMFHPLAEAKQLRFIYSADDVRVHSDLIKVKQITANLVSNAVKYTRAGTISLEIVYENEKIVIKVRDTGVGIASDQIPELYKPFTRVEKNNVLAHGSGLGMYVVKGLIDLLGGSIYVNSTVGRGTYVEVVIPASVAHFTIPRGTKKIVVYDDDPVVVRVTNDLLVQLGHQVVETDGDIILTDMEMDTISGLDVLAKAGNIPVIVMTGRGDFTRKKAIELGFEDFLPKPFTIDELRNIFGEGDKLPEDDLLGDDREEIMAIFRSSTTENFKLLQIALNENDFDKAQSICHKMLPMFAQLGYPVEALKRMDAHKGSRYDEWKTDVWNVLQIRV